MQGFVSIEEEGAMPADQTGILCIGSIMVDVLCPVDAIPAPGEGVIADGYRQALGGCA